ncbi:hypothetical protein ACIQNU_40240 [Streptomyces sp. NPDC091292]|uniref:hypothetical protein n=1 Tax=Streptomyces sp. NPDC091292 TaxID=3365991 RepID=UPI003815283A
MVAASAVVIASGVTGYVVLGGDKGDDAGPGPSASASRTADAADAGPTGPGASADDDNARGTDDEKATVDGWKVVVNARRGIAFDVPPEWSLKSRDWVTYVAEDDDPEDKPLVAMAAPASLKERWCAADENRDGTQEYTALATAGSRGENGARSTGEAARDNARLWVYGRYAQPDDNRVRTGPAEPYTTSSGLKGSVATASSSGTPGTGKCATEGTATAFASATPGATSPPGPSSVRRGSPIRYRTPPCGKSSALSASTEPLEWTEAPLEHTGSWESDMYLTPVRT